MNEMAKNYGPWALIAGASEGTGASFARLLAQKGFNLILIARRESPLEKLAGELRQENGVECIAASIDLSTDDAVEKMREAAAGREVGLLILNAGADPNGMMFLDNDIANWDELVMRNVVTVIRACHRFAQPMRKRGRGGIIIVGSAACYAGMPGIAIYGATKSFDLSFSEALWAELKPQGVNVLSFVIESTDTPAHRQLMEQRGMPLTGDMVDPDEVARVGLENLANGPVKNFSLADDEAGYAGLSAKQRRERTIMFAQLSARYATKGNGA